MAKSPQVIEEERWQAESDAGCLARSERIKADPKRLKRAKSAAVKMATESQKQVDSYKQVSSNTLTPKQILKKKK